MFRTILGAGHLTENKTTSLFLKSLHLVVETKPNMSYGPEHNGEK